MHSQTKTLQNKNKQKTWTKEQKLKQISKYVTKQAMRKQKVTKTLTSLLYLPNRLD